jgi:hypothetical protein
MPLVLYLVMTLKVDYAVNGGKLGLNLMTIVLPMPISSKVHCLRELTVIKLRPLCHSDNNGNPLAKKRAIILFLKNKIHCT